MVAKLKSSFLKNSFQLFCYKHLLSPAQQQQQQPPTAKSSDVTADDDEDELRRMSSSSPNLSTAQKNSEKKKSSKKPSAVQLSRSSSANSTTRNPYVVLKSGAEPRHQYKDTHAIKSSASSHFDCAPGSTNGVLIFAAEPPVRKSNSQIEHSENFKLRVLSSKGTANDAQTFNRHSYPNASHANNEDDIVVSSSNQSSQLYKNQSMAGLKLAKKVRL